MVPELANKYSWWQVVSVPVFFTEHRKSMTVQALMCIQHRHMLCGKFHICHDLDLDQNLNDNAYPTPFLHEALDVNQKMVMLGIGWYQNICLYLWVQHQHYPEHDTLCLSIFFCWIFPVFPLINYSMFTVILRNMVLELFSQTDIILWCERMHYNMWTKCFLSWKLNSRH